MKATFLIVPLTICTLFVSAQTSFRKPVNVDSLYETAQSSFNYSVLPTVPNFTSKAQTIGSQYYFENWVSGTVTDNNGVSFSEGYLFNYNKMTQNIYIRLKDSAAAFLVHKNLLQSAVLTDGYQEVRFERMVPGLDSNNLYQVMARGSRYNLYRLTRTNFTAANFFTNGVSSSGNMYDEFKDEFTYYLVDAQGKVTEVPLKKKTIRSLFIADKEKAAAFIRKNDTVETPADQLLASLVNYLNETL